MSGPLRPPEWFYVATLNKWAYYDAGRNVVVAEDGTHLPTTFLAAAAARNRTSAQSRQTTLSYNTAEAASSTSNAAMARSAVYQAYTGTSPHVPAVSVDDLGAAVGTLRVSSPTLPTNTPSRPHVLRGYDSSSNVESIYQTSPDKDITDPYLYERGVTAHAKILAGTGVRETLSPEYRLRSNPNKFFVPGKVFMVLWAEPAGAKTSVTALPITITRGVHQEYVFQKVRRFIVIRAGDHSCSALPIRTYHRRSQADFLAQEHGVVYTGRGVPERAVSVVGLQPQAIRVVPDDPTDKLDPESLVHYGKVYTIEHNIKVKPFGMVHDQYRIALYDQFKSVWMGSLGSRSSSLTSEPTMSDASSYLMTTPIGTSGASTSSLQPSSLTARQQAAIEEHSTATRPRTDPRRSVPAMKSQFFQNMADRGKQASGTSRRADQLYTRLKAALEDRGFDSATAGRYAMQRVERYLGTPGDEASRRRDDLQPGDDKSIVSDNISHDAVVDSVTSTVEAALAHLESRGITRDEAIESMSRLLQQFSDTASTTAEAIGKSKESDAAQ